MFGNNSSTRNRGKSKNTSRLGQHGGDDSDVSLENEGQNADTPNKVPSTKPKNHNQSSDERGEGDEPQKIPGKNKNQTKTQLDTRDELGSNNSATSNKPNPSNTKGLNSTTSGPVEAEPTKGAPKVDQGLKDLLESPTDYQSERNTSETKAQMVKVMNILKTPFDPSRNAILKPGSREKDAVEDAARAALEAEGVKIASKGSGFSVAAYVEGVTMAVVASTSPGAPPAIVVLKVKKPKLTRSNGMDDLGDAEVSARYWSGTEKSDAGWEQGLNRQDKTDYQALLEAKKAGTMGEDMKKVKDSALSLVHLRAYQAFQLLAARALAAPGAPDK